VRRGGGFEAQDAKAFASYSNARVAPTDRSAQTGFRVARDFRP
jgi:hypothetical protein